MTMTYSLGVSSKSALDILETMDRESTIQWLCTAQYPGGPVNGMIAKKCRWYGRQDVYPEITGYFISTFSKLFNQTGDKKFFEKARLAAQAIGRFIQVSGAVPSLINSRGQYEDRIYSFDQSIIAQGLWDFYGVCVSADSALASRIGELATRATMFLMQNIRSGFLPDQTTADSKVLSDFTYCIMGKAALPLVSAFRITQKQAYLEKAKEVLDYIVKNFRQPNGMFSLEAKHLRNRVHYHCYAIEGLLCYSEATDEKEYWNYTKDGGDFLLNYQKSNGGFKNYLPSSEDDGLEDVPPVSQAIVIWLKLYDKFKDPVYLKGIELGLAYLEKVKSKSFSKYLRGSLPFLIPASGFQEGCPWAAEFYLDISTYKDDLLANVKSYES